MKIKHVISRFFCFQQTLQGTLYPISFFFFFQMYLPYFRLCSRERKVVWERAVREIRPIYEVDHIRKHLAFKKVSREVIYNILSINYCN
jgi:hypothetical protein